MLLGVWIIGTKNGNTQELKVFAANKLKAALGLALVMLRIAPVAMVSRQAHEREMESYCLPLPTSSQWMWLQFKCHLLSSWPLPNVFPSHRHLHKNPIATTIAFADPSKEWQHIQTATTLLILVTSVNWCNGVAECQCESLLVVVSINTIMHAIYTI